MNINEDHEITILMSTYNEPNLKQALDSLEKQTKKDFQILLINDGGEDIKNILDKFPNLKINNICNPINLGLAKSLNYGISMINTKYIARMDSDDYSLPERLELQLKYLENKKLDLIGSAIIQSRNNSFSINHNYEDINILKKILMIRCPIAHPTWFGKTSCFKKILYNKNLRYGQDHDFVARAVLNKFKIGNVSTPLLIYNYTKNSDHSKTLIQMQTANLINKSYNLSLKFGIPYKEINNQNIKLNNFEKVLLSLRNMSFKNRNKLKKYTLLIIYLLLSLISPIQRRFNINNIFLFTK